MMSACRDRPEEVLEAASLAAAEGRIVEVQEAFSVASVQRLKRQWELASIRAEKGWSQLSQKLLFDGKALIDIDAATIYDNYAQVMADAGAERRDYYLHKEDGKWRIELGGGLRYRRSKARRERIDLKDKSKAETKKKALEAQGSAQN